MNRKVRSTYVRFMVMSSGFPPAGDLTSHILKSQIVEPKEQLFRSGGMIAVAAVRASLYTLAMDLFGGIEAGGTKFVCGIGTSPEDLEVHSFPTGGHWRASERPSNFSTKRRGLD